MCNVQSRVEARSWLLRLLLVLPLVLLSLAGCEDQQPETGGGVQVDKSYKDQYGQTVTDVQPGDELTVDVIVRGFSENRDQVTPFDAILLIDRSPSMWGSKIDNAKEAAKAFVRLARQESPSGTGSIRIGVVTFADEAEVVSPLSTDYTQLLDDIDGISTPWFDSTNFRAGMGKSQELLYTSSRTVRIILLLTDGRPTPDTDAQSQYIYGTLLPDAIEAGLRYYTIGVGSNPDSGLLLLISDSTGGKYESVADPEDLTGIFEQIFQHAAHTVIASRMELMERVNTADVQIVPGSWQFSEGILLPADSLLAAFAESGAIILKLGDLPTGRTRTFSFRVRPRDCLTPDDERESVLITPNTDTKVTFVYGQVPGEVRAFQPTLNCHKPPGLVIRKDYNAATSEVILTAESKYLPSAAVDNTIRNIQVYEFPSPQYQYRVGSAVPPVTRFIPSFYMDLLYWRIPTLAPQEQRELRFTVDLVAWTPHDMNPLRLNALSKDIVAGWATYIRPGGEKTNVTLPQRLVYVSTMDLLPEGRPDLYITPALDVGEFQEGVPEERPLDAELLSEHTGTLPADWLRLAYELFQGKESPDVWIDTDTNGFVNQWQPRDSPEVIAGIRRHITYATFDAMDGYFSAVHGQGDLWHRESKNRVYIRMENLGVAASRPIPGGLVLEAFDYDNGRWDLLQQIELPEVGVLANAQQLVYIELPANTLQPRHLQAVRGAELLPPNWDNLRTAELRISLGWSPTERHTNNNWSSEKLIVMP